MKNPIDINRLMWLGAGAGSKGVISGLVKGFVPQIGVTPDVVTLFVGFLLAQQGGKWISPFGEGMLIASVGQLVSTPIQAVFGKIAQPAETSNPGSNPGGNGHKEPTSLEAYNTAKGR
ncbi:hypothetical protein ES703_15040 [subsurface metagenome]